MLRPIVTNIKELSKKCDLIQEGEDITQVVQDLKDSFEPLKAKGFGLAANQIGINKAVAYIVFMGKEYILINPIIIEKEEVVPFTEGCFSLPGLQIKTRRYNHIKVKHGLEGKEEDFYGILAIVMQHECEHLEGRTLLNSKWRAR